MSSSIKWQIIFSFITILNIWICIICLDCKIRKIEDKLNNLHITVNIVDDNYD
jgi:hypothetical protein